jgi:hypothetical protein
MDSPSETQVNRLIGAAGEGAVGSSPPNIEYCLADLGAFLEDTQLAGKE